MTRHRHLPRVLRIGLRTLPLLLLPFAPALAAAGDTNVKFQRLSSQHGLSQAFIICGLQDRQGFMWFGTQEGLNRYDGHEFVTFNHDDQDPRSLAHDAVKSLLEDRDGVLWVGTEGGGLNRFHPGQRSFTHYRHNPQDPASLSDDRVWALLEDPSGDLWVGTDGGGLNRFDRATETFERFPAGAASAASEGHAQIRGLALDGDGTLWIATYGGGLERLDPATGELTRFRHDPQDPASLSDDRVRTVFVDRDGGLWVGTYRGLNRLDRGSGADGRVTFTRFRHDPQDPTSLSSDLVPVIYQDRDGALWIGTDNGLNLWRPESAGFVRFQHQPEDPYSLSHNRVASILQDRGGVLWVGTYDGLNKWNTIFGSFLHFRHQSDDPSQLSNNLVTSFAEDERQGVIWIGTFGGGLNRFADGRFRHYRHRPGDNASLSDDRVMALAVDRAGTLWAGTMHGGLNRFNGAASGAATGTFTHYRHDPEDPASLSSDGVTHLFEDRRGRLWVATYRGGLNRLAPATGDFVRYRHDPDDRESLSSDRILMTYEDAAGKLWIATHGAGLNRLDPHPERPETGRVARYRNDPQDPTSLSSDDVWAIVEDLRRDLWIGTQGSGLNRWTWADRRAGRAVFRRYTSSDGLRSENIYAILVDDEGALWLSHNRGLTKLDPETETFRHYDTSHGLQSAEFTQGAGFRTRDGQMYFGGINGFNVFYPYQIRDNTHVPQVVLTKFLKFNQTVDLGRPLAEVREIELSYKDYVVAFEFAALDYTAPAKNRYLHMLEGFDRDWVDSGSLHRATYTNLRPGDYTFRVKGSNNDGVWNDEGLTLKVRALPPPWRTAWAYLAYALSASGGVLLFARAQARKKQRAAELARANDSLTEEIAQREAKEQALEREKKKAQTYLDVAEVVMVVIDHAGKVSLINQKGAQLLGYDEEEILGKDWVEHFVPGEKRRQVKAWLESVEVRRGEGHEAYEYPVVTRGGDKRIIEWRTTRLPAENGTPAGTLSSGADITQMRRLWEAKESAETANRAKSQFLANMSHEIRTPMNGILGMVELLLSGDLTPRQRKFADTAHRSARNLLDILNDILDFSKIEAGKLELENVDFDLRHLVEDLAELFAEHALEDNLELVCMIADDVPTALSGDPTRLRQILSNLVGNAIKFTEQGEVAVAVAGVGVGTALESVRFEVRDTGIGLEPKAREKIFEYFQQADGSTTRKFGGTGLGLSISKELVALMGGEMGVESVSGEGSTFWFTVPVKRQRKPVEVPRPPFSGSDAPRLLVVDDNASSRDSLLHQLAGLGIAADAAPDGPHAVQMLLAAATRGTPYDVALVDQLMPGMDGLELASTLRTMPALRDQTIVLLTSAGPPDEETVRSAGIRCCLAKPVRRSELYDCIAGPGDSVATAVVETERQTVSLSGARILLVEDSLINQDVVLSMLAGVNARVDVAPNGRKALELAARADYDLVLMDCQMPHMDGYQATRNLRDRESRSRRPGVRRVPIIAMTANAMRGDRERCLAAGMDDYLSKPFRLTELRACLERWLPEKYKVVDPAKDEPRPARPAVGRDRPAGPRGVPAPATPQPATPQPATPQPATPQPATPQPAAPDPLDRSAFDSIRKIDPDDSKGLIERMIRNFLNHGPELLARLREAVTQGDAKAIEYPAHTLKSNCGFLGATQLMSLCQEMERMSRKVATERAPIVLADIEVEFARVGLALEAELNEVRVQAS